MVTDSHSHSVFQVNVNNNGACLRGTVTLLMKLPDKSEPFGLAFDGTNLYVSDSSDDGGITRFHMATSQRVMIVKNGTPLCQTVHGVDVTKDGHVVFTDRGSRIVRTLSQEGSHTEIRVLAGSGADASKDGSHLAASFCQPTSLCVEGKTVFVTDTAIGAVKMVTPTASLCTFLEIIHVLCKMFAIHLRGVPGEDHKIEETVASLNEMSSAFELWVNEVQEKMGRKLTVQGPQGTISAKSRRSLEIMTESLSMLGQCLTEINPDFHSVIKLAATLTLVVENFFSKMRSRNDMPTALEFAHLFGPTIRETLKQLTDTDYVYYTAPSSHYEAPEMMKLSFRELPSVPFPISIEMGKEDQKILRDWRDNFGKPVRQLTVRNQSTKDNVGTLPIFAYTTPDPPPQPLNFSAMTDLTATSARAETNASSCETRRTILFRGESGLSTSGPFFVGSLNTDVSDDDHESYFDLKLYVPSFEDCLNFIHHGKVNVHRDAVICTVDKRETQIGDSVIKLSEEAYETLLSELKDVEDLLPEGESCDEASDEESDEENASNLLVETTPFRTLSGRIVSRPNRLDL